ncbi:MAG: YbjN domain-containing protein [Maritimibacter sp.]
MRNSVFSSVLSVACIMGGLAAAQDATPETMILASDPSSVLTHLNATGYPAKLTEDSVGDPLIEFRLSGERYDIFFYDCTKNEDCQALQFYAGFNVGGSVELDTLNEWNADRRFVRAYMVDGGDAVRIELDVATSNHGIHPDDFSDIIDLWKESVSLFEARIDW